MDIVDIVEKALQNSLDFKRHIIQRVKLKFFQASHYSKFGSLPFNLFGENNLYFQVNGASGTQNCTVLFSWALEGGTATEEEKKLDWHSDRTKRKTKVPRQL